MTLNGISLKGSVQSKGDVEVFKPWAHLPDCSCEPEETYTCQRCGRRVGYCLGSYDNMPEACDFCWRP